MDFRSVRAGMQHWLALLVVAAVVGGCGDRPTSPVRQLSPGDADAAAGGRKARVSITSVALSSSTIVAGGAETPYDITLQNSGTADATGILVQAEIVQGQATVVAGGFAAGCPNFTGVLPPGSCTASFAVAVPNDGTLSAGSAKLVLTLMQTVNGVTTALDTKTLKVNIVLGVPALTITDLQLASTTLTINGAGTTYSVTMNNPTSVNQSLVVIQGEIIQGTSYRGAGGTNVSCGAASGVLPPGNCTMTYSTAANNNNAGAGTLVPGSATFKLSLLYYDGVTTTTVDYREIPITLVSP